MDVTLIKSTGWNTLFNSQSTDTTEPEVNKIYKVVKSERKNGLLFYKLEGFNDMYCAEFFKPVDRVFVDNLLYEISKQPLKLMQ